MNETLICPVCGAELSTQKGFAEELKDWECKKCKTQLHRDFVWNAYEPVKNEICPVCKDNLRNQRDYYPFLTDWRCKSCGSVLLRNSADEDYRAEQNEICPACRKPLVKQEGYFSYLLDWECTNCGAHIHRNYWNEPYVEFGCSDVNQIDASAEPMQVTVVNGSAGNQWNASEADEEKKRGSAGLPKLQALGRSIADRWKEKHGYAPIPVGYDRNELVGKDLDLVKQLLIRSGFSNINDQGMEDLTYDQIDQNRIVGDIVFEGANTFDKASRFLPREEVAVFYHSPKWCDVPVSARSVKGILYEDIQQAFMDAGFRNIVLWPKGDLVLGVSRKEGRVISVMINGKEVFKAGERYRADAKVVITYHSRNE